MGVSKNRGTPKWMVYNGKPYWNGWFWGTTILGNPHILFTFFKMSWIKPMVWFSTSSAFWDALCMFLRSNVLRHFSILVDAKKIHYPHNYIPQEKNSEKVLGSSLILGFKMFSSLDLLFLIFYFIPWESSPFCTPIWDHIFLVYFFQQFFRSQNPRQFSIQVVYEMSWIHLRYKLRKREFISLLGGGFKYFLFSPLLPQMMQFDYIICLKGVEITN